MISDLPQDFIRQLTAEYGVSDAEFEALALALRSEPTVAIASTIGISEVAVRKRLGEVYRKFNITGIRPGKIAELKQFLISQYQARNRSTTNSRTDWGEAPDLGAFYGRIADLNLLKQWVNADSARLVAILGMTGCGKTSLSVQFAQQNQTQFDFVIWRSLRNSPSVTDLVTTLIEFISQQPAKNLPDDSNSQISLLLECLQAHRCLIVLDDFETLLQTEELAGYYRTGYEEYRELFQRVAEINHQSCLILISSEAPAELALLSVNSVKQLKPTGADIIAKEIFKEKGLSATPEEWQKLLNRYRDNLLAFKIVAITIKDFFNGHVSQFLEATALFVDDTLTYLLEQQFERLTSSEEDVMYWLAIIEQQIGIFQLKQQFFESLSLSEYLNNLDSLERRSLIEKTTTDSEIMLQLQPLIKKYVTQQLVQQVTQEVQQLLRQPNFSNFSVLKNYCLGKSCEKQQINTARQSSQLLQQLANNLQNKLRRSEGNIYDSLKQLGENLKKQPRLKVGYAGANLNDIISKIPSN
ncbi:WD-40 repeat-containing protein [Crinalium epipsammum PCC 9333]|uniref:WD-40 repeat-containing protein n=1 Tax=Crinalium epipsammum PCC 9333 TaxID=1173022 RepID=K9VTZ3_9CYAN|nr:NB-ARC domain-containing protein [Crinalium epipsammum]AFZ11543.1 WD-40 repeat-containing protein [Crinalium epipsammum PCC 9333]